MLKVLLVLKVHKVIKDKVELMLVKELKVQQVLKVLLGQVLKELLELRVLKVHLEIV